MSTITPRSFMNKWRAAKAACPDCLLIVKLGDFYEAFNEDAQRLARLLGLSITSRSKTDPEPVPMAGFPYHQLESYLGKLVAEGIRVALVEEMDAVPAPYQPKGQLMLWEGGAN